MIRRRYITRLCNLSYLIYALHQESKLSLPPSKNDSSISYSFPFTSPSFIHLFTSKSKVSPLNLQRIHLLHPKTVETTPITCLNPSLQLLTSKVSVIILPSSVYIALRLSDSLYTALINTRHDYSTTSQDKQKLQIHPQKSISPFSHTPWQIHHRQTISAHQKNLFSLQMYCTSTVYMIDAHSVSIQWTKK